MKKMRLIGCCLLLSTPIFAATVNNQAMTDDSEKQSYALGYKTGAALKQQSITINTNNFAQGLTAGYKGEKPALSDQDMQTTLQHMRQQVTQKMQANMSKIADENLKTGDEFLAKNAKGPGVITLPSGLQYQVIKPGSGENPKPNDTVTVNYEGKLINGTVFDSSYKRGQPATFRVGDVISGWQEALQLMKPGATYMLYIPAKLAYGQRGAGAAIGPNETLIFKVDLISINK